MTESEKVLEESKHLRGTVGVSDRGEPIKNPDMSIPILADTNFFFLSEMSLMVAKQLLGWQLQMCRYNLVGWSISQTSLRGKQKK